MSKATEDINDAQSSIGNAKAATGGEILPFAARALQVDPRHFKEADAALEVIQFLEQNSITSCVIGVKALQYYGSFRLPVAWEICVPTDQLSSAKGLFDSGPPNTFYHPWQGYDSAEEPNIGSLYHTFPRYKLQDRSFEFYLIPAEDYRLDCIKENFEWSTQKHVPYPKLDILVQCFVDTQNFLDLEDIIDAMDLDEEWGKANLDFSKPQQEYISWATAKNVKILAALPAKYREDWWATRFGNTGFELGEEVVDFREVFTEKVRNKPLRIGQEFPLGVMITKYWLARGGDPRLQSRDWL